MLFGEFWEIIKNFGKVFLLEPLGSDEDISGEEHRVEVRGTDENLVNEFKKALDDWDFSGTQYPVS